MQDVVIFEEGDIVTATDAVKILGITGHMLSLAEENGYISGYAIVGTRDLHGVKQFDCRAGIPISRIDFEMHGVITTWNGDFIAYEREDIDNFISVLEEHVAQGPNGWTAIYQHSSSPGPGDKCTQRDRDETGEYDVQLAAKYKSLVAENVALINELRKIKDNKSSGMGNTTKANEKKADNCATIWQKNVLIATKLTAECVSDGKKRSTAQHQIMWNRFWGKPLELLYQGMAFRNFRNGLPSNLKFEDNR